MTSENAFFNDFERFWSPYTALGTLKHGTNLAISAGGFSHGVLQVNQEKK